jgi:hypothetical protein
MISRQASEPARYSKIGVSGSPRELGNRLRGRGLDRLLSSKPRTRGVRRRVERYVKLGSKQPPRSLPSDSDTSLAQTEQVTLTYAFKFKCLRKDGAE